MNRCRLSRCGCSAVVVERRRLPSLGNSHNITRHPVHLLQKLVLVIVAALALHGGGKFARAQDVPKPADHLGFVPGADFHLASWTQVVDYFRKVDNASDRVIVRELGRTTEDRPYIVAFVASPGTLAKLEEHREIQKRIADPRLFKGSAAETSDVVNASKTVVLITCSIHSSETASTLMAMELLHELAASNEPRIREILDQTILLLVPSANPDGVDKVAEWYERSKGRPWEGGGMPWLYHKYAGHDTNRDWFMLNLKETQILTRFLYQEWFPTITYDVHQMGSRGARLFVPPFYDPINPNLDPRINQSIALIGAHMAADLARAKKSGVLTHAMYDNWWNGGNRTTPQRHNMVGVLTEAASVKLASPVFVEQDELRGTARGFANHKPAVNFVDPWPGGWWRLRDVVDYELICSRSVLTLAARYKEAFQNNYLALGRDAIQRGRDEPPFGWVIPAGQPDPGRAETMVRVLRDSGIEVRQATVPFQAGGISYPAWSWILSSEQPYRAHLKDMMERQVYPPRFTAQGAAEAPYDVAGWTLPLQMGLRVAEIDQKQDRLYAALDGATGSVDELFPIVDSRPVGPREVANASSSEEATHFLLRNQANDDFRILNAVQRAGGNAGLVAGIREEVGSPLVNGMIVFAADGKTTEALTQLPDRLTSRIIELRGGGKKDALSFRPLGQPRIGVYQPWVPSMDEGWTRLVLENHGFAYKTLHNAEIRAGNLIGQVDVLLVPSIDPKTLRDGYTEAATEPAYVGGLGQDGAEAVRQFVNGGGTLICLENSCGYAIEVLKLGVREVLKDLPSSAFYCPGSILHVRYRPPGKIESAPSLLTLGMPDEGAVYFDRSLAFDASSAPAARVWATYTGASPSALLESGWLLGADKIQDKAALVEVASGRGRVVLFGFPPQHRGQTHGTFRLLFNALALSGKDSVPAPSGAAPMQAGEGAGQ